jgi:hypothetical protein
LCLSLKLTICAISGEFNLEYLNRIENENLTKEEFNNNIELLNKDV